MHMGGFFYDADGGCMKEEKKLPRWLIMFLVVFIVVAFIVGVVVGIIIWSIVFNKAPEQSQDLYTTHLGLLQFYLAFVAVVVTVLVFILTFKIGDVERRAERAVKTAEEAANKAVDKLSKTMRTELEASSAYSMGVMNLEMDAQIKKLREELTMLIQNEIEHKTGGTNE
jgi:heme/copper-type cytochrome/quinol oxidase subunit 2